MPVLNRFATLAPVAGGVFACLWAAACGAQLPADLPVSSDYRGEIRRGPDGKLMAVPPSAGAEAGKDETPARATLVVGPGERLKTVTEAAAQARDGDVIEIRAGDYRRQPVVWTQNNLVIRGTGQRPVMIADGASAEGKAIWVVRGGNIRIENIEFRGARVPDGNGAGIRFEKGHLVLRRCAFFDNEMGLLAANSADLTLDIADSEFASAPTHAGPLHHLLYVGAIGKFTLTGSRLQQGYLGHLVKSRARESHVLYNLLVDGPQGRASYELEFPNGGVAYVIGNAIGQSANTDNPAVVAYGAEGQRWGDNALYLVHNTLTSEGANAYFLKTWPEKFPASTEVWAINNLTVGYGSFTAPPEGRFEGNQTVGKGELIPVGGVPLRLTTLAPLRGSVRLPGSVRGMNLAPDAEFVFPAGKRPVVLPNAIAPGAFQ